MAHRGRLNVLAHNLGRSYQTIFGEFEGTSTLEVVKAVTEIPQGGTGDVKYHHGYTRTYKLRNGGEILVNLEANPSHLEFVDPVVLGATRAAQTDRKGPHARSRPARRGADPCCTATPRSPARASSRRRSTSRRLDGYKVGGALHLVQNNQVGFTTDFEDSRSTTWASDLAKGFDVPIIHVNADDVEACIAAVRLAMAFRDGVRPRRPDRPDRLPALRPQRGRRARLHAARDVRADQAPRARVEALRDGADRGRRRHQGGGRRLAAGELGRADAPASGPQGDDQGARRRQAASTSRPASTSSTARRARPSTTAVPADKLRGLNERAADARPRASPSTRSSSSSSSAARGARRRGRHRLGAGRGARIRLAADRGRAGPPDRPGRRARHVQPAPPGPARREDRPDLSRRSSASRARRRRWSCTTARCRRSRAWASSTATRRRRRRRSCSGRRSSATSPTARR